MRCAKKEKESGKFGFDVSYLIDYTQRSDFAVR
jgi:hypothetical protein